MSIDLATVALLGAVQAWLMAIVLWTSTGSYAGVARASLRIRAVALGLEAAAWVLLGLRGQVGEWLSILVANGVMLVSYAMTVHALRMLLGVPQRRRLAAAVAAAGWLAIAWFAVVDPDYQARVLCATLAVLAYLAMMLLPLSDGLRRGGSSAKRVLLVILTTAMWMLCWRLAEPLLSARPAGGFLASSFVNTAFLMFSAMQPLFTSIGFLLLYNETMQKELKSLARIDPLTGVANRLALVEAAERLLEEATRDGRPLGVLMLDADHFKSVNDRFGHSGGDKVLRAFTASIQRALDGGEVFGRIGGEEFVVLSPGIGLAEALALAGRLRAAVAGMGLAIDGQTLALTVSVGVAAASPGERDVASLLRRADAALYAAKRAGRDRVMVADGDPAQPPA
ncbi:hypothetical protein ASG87_14945 [Frateuria sp. Soil773]|uniref:GGDEF domain-containing protein n=1 Tax=Frateuria sp. Soil773 TaxID=1736407 RepID=UPI0006FF8D7B|nr:diguanylate cyclase [Frateuria sp. Soil773]KRE97820.1 hypothetical protein ASG87_14945 [Frateuria sp. Soil773]